MSKEYERKEIKEAYYKSEANGKSMYVATCPFCNKKVTISAWRGEKKCECGAVLTTKYGARKEVRP